MKNLPNYTIFMGSPGTGKSTLLNANLGKVEFQSGVQFGSGLTSEMQLVQDEESDVYYCDTPGLDDVQTRVRSAQEITRALRTEKGRFKLVFVVNLDAGRIRGIDVAMMKLVLDCVPKHQVPYGIIINKVSEKLLERLDAETYKDLFSTFQLPSDKYATPSVAFYPHLRELYDEDNVLHEPLDILQSFLESVQPVVLEPEEVQDMDYASLDDVALGLKMLLAETKKADEHAASGRMEPFDEFDVTKQQQHGQEHRESAIFQNVALTALFVGAAIFVPFPLAKKSAVVRAAVCGTAAAAAVAIAISQHNNKKHHHKNN